MRSRRTHRSTKVFRLPGGNEDNDLWVELKVDESNRCVISSTWEPTAEERDFIARGGNVELLVWGGGTPPVFVDVTDTPLGRPPPESPPPEPPPGPPDPPDHSRPRRHEVDKWPFPGDPPDPL